MDTIEAHVILEQARLFEKCRSFAPAIEFEEAETESSVVARFEKQVKQYSRHLAVKTPNLSLTYEALNQAANRLGWAILNQIGSDEEPVAFLLEHGAEQIIAIFGILKAGKFYLSLDASFPSSRLSYMLEDAQARLVVTNDNNLPLAKEIVQDKGHLINLNELDLDLSAENLDLSISPDCLVSIQYTSGSSGQPKGVLSKHRNLLHGMWSYTHHFGYCSKDRMALLLSTSFSASVSPVFGSLLNGATLLPFDVKNGLPNLANWLLEEQITFLMAVPSLFRHFAMILSGDEQFPHLRLISLGGEPVLRSDVDLYKRYFSPDCILRTSLSGTEMGTACTLLIDKQSAIEENVVPVGFPYDEREILILDEEGHEVGFGEVGEIVVRSEFLSPGYWRKPELTREKFSEDPRGTSKRLYRTGDLGRMRPDGCLLHLGRKDFQVKIRGFRVELEEIESVLMQYPGILEALVMVDERPDYEKRLVVYLVPRKAGEVPSAELLRTYLGEKLPDYMVPSIYVPLEGLPLTATGKVDRKALPSLEQAWNLEQDYILLQDELEAELAALWENILGVRPIGRNNDFFTLGGNSLLAARLISQIEGMFGRRLQLADLLEAPSVGKMASLLKRGQVSSEKKSLVPLQPNGSWPPFYIVHGVGGHLLRFHQLAEHMGPDYPLYGLQSSGIDGNPELFDQIEDMAAAYLREVRGFQPEGPYYLGGFSFGGFVAYEMACQLEKEGHRTALLAIFDTKAYQAPKYRQALTGWKTSQFKARSLVESSRFLVQSKFHISRTVKGLLQGKNSKPTTGTGYIEPGNGKPFPAHLQHVMEPELLALMNEEDRSSPYQRVMETNISALMVYVPKIYPGKVTLFKAFEAGKGLYYGWNELAQGGVEEHEICGTHLKMVEEPNVSVLAQKLKTCIERAAQDGSVSG